MEDSAPKRRKTSSDSNLPVDADGSSREPSSDGSLRRSARHRRPSFASPTKASLARTNPEILERRNSARAESLASAPAASEPDTNESLPKQLAAQLEGASETGPLSGNGGKRVDNGEPESVPDEAGKWMRSLPRRTSIKPSPRPLPPPSAEEEELLGPFKGRALRRSPQRGVMPTIQPEEPELPPTPTEKGLSDPASVHTSPPGIHNTPTKRPRRSRALAEKMMKSSPLKQPPLRPIDFNRGSLPSPISRQVSKNETTLRSGKVRIAANTTNAARAVPEPDPLAEKKKLRESLQAQVLQLQADLGVAKKENDRLVELQRSSKSAIAPESEETDALLDVIRRHALPVEKEAPPNQLQDWLEAAANPMSFLPFGDPSSALPILFDPAPETTDERLPPPISHHPIPMTAAEELPYLQLFTPLTFTSSVVMVPREREDESGPLMQKHAIAVSSTPRGLFAAKIEMVVNTKNFSIAELTVPRLDPLAIVELGPFIERITQGGGNSAMKRNVSVFTWAMAEWTRLATKRARFWVHMERELGSRDAILECAQEARKRKRRGRQPVEYVEDDEEEAGEKKTTTKADLLSHMGRTHIDLDLGDPGDQSGQGPNLRLSWQIEFDWTGEGRSKVRALVEVPGKWHANDEKGSITEIPAMFDRLIRGGVDTMEAVKAVVALLVGEV